MALPDQLVCCSGIFDELHFFDQTTLEKQFSISTATFSSQNLRLAQLISLPSCRGGGDALPAYAVATGTDADPFSILVYDVETRELFTSIQNAHSGICYSLACVPTLSRTLIVSGTWGGPIVVTDPVTCEIVSRSDDDHLSAFRISHFEESVHWGDFDVFVGADKRILHYDVAVDHLRGVYQLGGRQCYYGLAASICRGLLFSASFSSNSVRMWSPKEFRCVGTTQSPSGAFSCHFVESKNLLLVGTVRSSVLAWDVRNLDQPVFSVPNCGDYVHDLDLVGEDRVVAGASSRMSMFTLSGKILRTEKVQNLVFGVRSLTGNDETLFDLAVESERIRFVLGRADRLWQVKMSNEVTLLSPRCMLSVHYLS